MIFLILLIIKRWYRHIDIIAMISEYVILIGNTNNDEQYGYIHHLKWEDIKIGLMLDIKKNIAIVLCTLGYNSTENDVNINNNKADILQLLIEYK